MGGTDTRQKLENATGLTVFLIMIDVTLKISALLRPQKGWVNECRSPYVNTHVKFLR